MSSAKQTKKTTGDEKIVIPSIKRSILKKQIIDIFYRDGLRTIAELCEATNSSIPSITNIMIEFSERGLVKNFGIGESKGGRRPSMYGIDPNAAFIMGIELSRNFCRLGIFNLRNEEVTPIKQIETGLNSKESIVSVIKNETDAYIIENKINPSAVLGFGISIPGLIDKNIGVSYSFPQFEKRSIEESFKNVLNGEVCIENDTKTMALSELWFGQARNKKNVLFINIGSGIGLGIIAEGELYRGHSGFSGEFGHIQMDTEGELCYCGKIGCLETIASGTALINKARVKIRDGKNTIIKKLVNNDETKIKLHHIINAAKNGDLLAIELIEEAGEFLAKGISTLIHLFNPESIIIGGEMSEAGNLIINPVEQKLNKYTMRLLKQDTIIELSQLNEKSGILGTLPLVADRILS